jgi:hypothetical protein
MMVRKKEDGDKKIESTVLAFLSSAPDTAGMSLTLENGQNRNV